MLRIKKEMTNCFLFGAIILLIGTHNYLSVPTTEALPHAQQDSSSSYNVRTNIERSAAAAARRAFSNNNLINDSSETTTAFRQSNSVQVLPGESATLHCQIEDLAGTYARERSRMSSQPGRDDGPEATIRRLVRWWRVPHGDKSGGVAQPVDPSREFDFDITFSRSDSAAVRRFGADARSTLRRLEHEGEEEHDGWSHQQQQKMPDVSTLKIFRVKDEYKGMYWCNYTADSGQLVIRTFTVLLKDNENHNHHHQLAASSAAGDVAARQTSNGAGKQQLSDNNGGEMNNDDASATMCYECIPKAENDYCTRVRPSAARRPCPTGRCLSMSAQCDGIAEPLRFALCDTINYEGWTEMVLSEPVRLEAGRCAVISDEMEATILSDAAIGEPLNHIQNALRARTNAVDMRTYHYDMCNLQQVKLCRCDTDGCNIDSKFLANETVAANVADAEPDTLKKPSGQDRLQRVGKQTDSATLVSAPTVAIVFLNALCLVLLRTRSC